MYSFHGKGKKSSYFEGWYFKQSGPGGTVCFIPAFHINAKGKPSASLQIITDEDSCHIRYPAEDFFAGENKFLVQVDKSQFSRKGCQLDVDMRDAKIKGALYFDDIVEPKYDIMGPFKYVPFMECRHAVISLGHRVSGKVSINNKSYVFEEDLGYIEGDRGVSFPRNYFWTHCSWEDAGIMLSVARIPFLGKSFWGCVGFVYVEGKEHRIATYLGAKVERLEKRCVSVSQGQTTVIVNLIEENPHPLWAPSDGTMSRAIHENASCTVRYRFFLKGECIFDYTDHQAGYEWVNPKMKTHLEE